jgi:DNA replication protein DnaC
MSLTNMQYDEIIRSYNRTQLENQRDLNERINTLFDKLPRIKEINDEISSMSLETTKLILSENSNGSELDEFKQKLELLRSEKAELLKKNGFPSNYLDIHYKCKDCKDTGYVDNKKCHCFKKAEIEILYNQSNIRDILAYENFNYFNIDYFNDFDIDSATGKTPKANMVGVLDICHNFVDNFQNKERKYSNLLFFGKTGVGKTYLTHCIAKELIERTSSVIYLSAINFFDILSKSEFSKNDEASKNKSSQIYSCDLLIIDDLGTELSNSFTNSALFNTINDRILNYKSTIISTNLVFSELMERYSERLTSRLAKEYTFMKIYGEDLRHKRK